MPISPIVPLAPVTPTAGVPSAGRDDRAALALARAALNRSQEVLGALVGQTTASNLQPNTVALGELGGEPQDVETQAADAHSPTAALKPAQQEPLERAIVLAADRAVQRQGGLAPLMADMAQAALEPATPRPVKQAIDQVLALARPLGSDVTARHVRQALDQSGLFMEARLAASLPQSGATASPRHALPVPSNDLKAALLVFRQVVKAWTEVVVPPIKPAAAAPAGRAPPPAALPAGATNTSTPQLTQDLPAAAYDARVGAPAGLATAPALVRGVVPPASLGVSTAAQPVLPDPSDDTAPLSHPARPPPVLSRPEIPGLVAKTFERAVAEALGAEGELPEHAPLPGSHPARLAPNASGTGHRSRPAPPPYAGAPTHAQPAAQPGLPPGSHPGEVAHRLLQGAGAALARTELLQLASRPEGAVVGSKAEEPGARWVFDMPFPTPQGPAVAQFEISRDGGGGEAAVRELGRTWRARFSLDVEPMGPIHAQIALTGDWARVSLWAERPDGMARLRGEQSSLQAALREASLEPELVFHPGSPQGPVVEPGRFVDRAT